MAVIYIPYEGPIVTRQAALGLGLKKYFTSVPCVNGHISQRSASTRVCVGCQQAALEKARCATLLRHANDPIVITARQQAALNGETRYFTGKPCKRGHIADRIVASSCCVVCRKDMVARIPKEKKAAYSADWRERNPEKAREVWQRHAKNNREKQNAWARAQYAEDPEKGRARAKAWRDKNPEGVRAHAMTRYGRKRGCEGSYDHHDIRDLLKIQKHKCAECKCSVKKAYHVDHIFPLSKGGYNGRPNLQILCPSCNMSKHNLDPIDWAQRRGRLL